MLASFPPQPIQTAPLADTFETMASRARDYLPEFDSLGGKSVGFVLLAWISFVAIVTSLFLAKRDTMQEVPMAFTRFALIAATLIFAVPRLAERDPLCRAFAHPVLRYVGRRSYGLYLYQDPIFRAAETYRHPGSLSNYLIVVRVEIALSLIATELFWRFIEQPMLRVKKRFSWRNTRTVAVPAI
jgi:peptidoglycan/LPS O-acetylase OafA/YrhL